MRQTFHNPHALNVLKDRISNTRLGQIFIGYERIAAISHYMNAHVAAKACREAKKR